VTFWNAQAETLPRERLEALALEPMRAIERPQGKAVRVVDRRGVTK